METGFPSSDGKAGGSSTKPDEAWRLFFGVDDRGRTLIGHMQRLGNTWSTSRSPPPFDRRRCGPVLAEFAALLLLPHHRTVPFAFTRL